MRWGIYSSVSANAKLVCESCHLHNTVNLGQFWFDSTELTKYLDSHNILNSEPHWEFLTMQELEKNLTKVNINWSISLINKWENIEWSWS